MITATAETSIVGGKVMQTPEVDGRSVSSFSPAAVYAQMERILASATFVRSKRLGRFLRFTVEQSLEGRQGSLKEYLVGVEVFNKLETFDPRIDSIVRVEARRLRSKLERYYQTEGRDDSVVIQFRKGSYVPLILTQDQLQAMSSASPVARSGAKSIAISRFTNLGVEAAYAFFCSGLTEDLISALTKVADLRVVARDTNLSISDDANGDYVLSGSVRKQGDRLRISVQLIETSTSLYVWSETYERDLSDAFAVQDEISRAIVTSLKREFQQHS